MRRRRSMRVRQGSVALLE
ncbi:hypothetical protein L195_g055967, partial [Trifolium pratense]